MRKEFFYQHSQRLKTIFAKAGVGNIHIAFDENIPAIYVGSNNQDGNNVIYIRQELEQLALKHDEIFNGLVIPIENAKDADERNALRFDIFLSEGLRGQTIFGHLEQVKILLAEGANINHQHSDNQQTALHFGLRKLTKLIEDIDAKEMDASQNTLAEFKKVQATVKYLLQYPIINTSIKDRQGKTSAEVFIENLKAISYRAQHSKYSEISALITEIITLIKSKGANILPSTKTKELDEQSNTDQNERFFLARANAR